MMEQALMVRELQGLHRASTPGQTYRKLIKSNHYQREHVSILHRSQIDV